MPPAGFEPAACGLEVRCSIQLSYRGGHREGYPPYTGRFPHARTVAGQMATLRSPAVVLFACLFLTQAGLLVLSPTLPELADDFGVSTATAGQLRTVAGASGGIVAVALSLAPWRPGLRSLLQAGAMLIGAGAVATAAAPSFAVLAVAQAVMGAGIGTVVAIGIAAAGCWPAPEDRPRTLAWAIVGMPVAWVVGMPLT